MNTKELSYLLQHPDQLQKDQAYPLEKIVKAFPYFQAARSLFLKSLKDQESFRYNQELKTTAAYTTDRSVLFEFITSDLFVKNTTSRSIPKKQNSDIVVIDSKEVKAPPRMAMDDAVKMKIKEAEDVLDPSLFSTRKEESTLKQIEIAKTTPSDNVNTPSEQEQTTSDVDKALEEKLQIHKPLDFNKKETHSFAEWLKLTSLTPLNQAAEKEILPETETSENKTSEKSSTTLQQKDKFDLIDEFISNNPKIQPPAKNIPSRNLAKESMVPTDELMTETLARVYLAQKNYKKAIQAYNILILKNPEKSGFFADQIRAIKKLQENK